jgi:hypothetical protein
MLIEVIGVRRDIKSFGALPGLSSIGPGGLPMREM